MTDEQRLAGYIDVARHAIDDFVALLESLPAQAWSSPTDLPGWDVKAVAAHVAHLESVLAGRPDGGIEDVRPGHMSVITADYTERGVNARRDHAPADIIVEIRSAAESRFAVLDAEPPTDGKAVPETSIPVSWSWDVLLRNRPLDVWMHEQDIRRAVGMPGGFDSAAARHTVEYLAEAFGFIVAKRAGAEPGSTVVLELDGGEALAIEVSGERRGVPLPSVPKKPTVRLTMSTEAFVMLSGGRRVLATDAVTIEGDHVLAARILGSLTTTP